MKFFDVPTPQERASKEMIQARRDKNADRMYAAAVFALRQGLASEFHAGVDEVLKLDPKHRDATRVLAVRELMARPIPKSPALEQELRAFVPKRNMKVEWSEHFVLIHDTPTPAPNDRTPSRAKRRLELLERVYETFLLTFFAQGVDLQVPTERMKVVLFDQFANYRQFSTRLSPALSSASGFWSSDSNTSVFFAHATHATNRELKKQSEQLNRLADQAVKMRSVGAADLRHLSDTLTLLLKVMEEDADITVVSHEGTHQLAGNTGLFPREVYVPKWVHEGLATYFECPNDATWAGIGAVNEERIDWYRAWASDPARSSIELVVSDAVFSFAETFEDQLFAYSQAWALTHFMLEKHFAETVSYYRAVGELPPDMIFRPDVLLKVFDREFEGQRPFLNSEWKSYMRELRTTLERVLEDAV